MGVTIECYLMRRLLRVVPLFGSASEGFLHVGDRIAAIDTYDATKLNHCDAQNIIRGAGMSLTLKVIRPGAYQQQQQPYSSRKIYRTIR